MLKLLIDTNVFIPLEPSSSSDISENTSFTAKLARLSNQGKCELWVHPAQKVDIQQDKSSKRKAVRLALLQKYPMLRFELGEVPTIKTNDWVDHHLMEALRKNAVAMLVTEDVRLTRKIQRELGAERVVSTAEAVALLTMSQEDEYAAIPAVESVDAYQLDPKDPIWASFRSDYRGFDQWLGKCQREHRKCFVVRNDASGKLDAVTIVNEEKNDKRGEKTLKICSFKVAEYASGNRLGELLFKAIFVFAFEQGYDSMYITAFSKHTALIGLLLELGFLEEAARKDNDEIQFHKLLKSSVIMDLSISSLEYHIRYGPYGLNLNCEKYIVPIQPKYHQMLFPERQVQPPLIPTKAGCANAIRKVYVSRSRHAALAPGSLLLFYQSGVGACVNCFGVVEHCIRSASRDEVVSYVMPRTVYTSDEIEEMVNSAEILAIRFRQCLRSVSPAITLSELIAEGVVSGAPQSISRVKEGCESWMMKRLA